MSKSIKTVNELKEICISHIAKNLLVFKKEEFIKLPRNLLENVLSCVIKYRMLNDKIIDYFLEQENIQ